MLQPKLQYYLYQASRSCLCTLLTLYCSNYWPYNVLCCLGYQEYSHPLLLFIQIRPFHNQATQVYTYTTLLFYTIIHSIIHQDLQAFNIMCTLPDFNQISFYYCCYIYYNKLQGYKLQLIISLFILSTYNDVCLSYRYMLTTRIGKNRCKEKQYHYFKRRIEQVIYIADVFG